MEIRAPIFTVGNPAQAEILLELDDAADRIVFDAPQLRDVDCAGPELLPRIEQEFRSQEASDMIGAKRRRRADAGIRWGGGSIHEGVPAANSTSIIAQRRADDDRLRMQSNQTTRSCETAVSTSIFGCDGTTSGVSGGGS